ncbi:hypothetical protein [Nocardiopsis composta]|uniref:Uncharacterized protein n=1 Tax=Nocardiopsis composta TaxID=157465 RepID=A0A7W8QJE9_9ACTN|nr:hypothetical protein [Nocardiopsis composta]MBB5430845.1 hypothetical protein [Nocardiopsis composta]
MDDRERKLRELRKRFEGKWLIRCTANLWIATSADILAPYEPTITEMDVDRFIDRLENPRGKGDSAVHPILKMVGGWEQIGDGVYKIDKC